MAGMHKASWEATKGAFKGAGLFALIFTVTLDVAEWLADYEDRDPITGKPKRDVYDLGAKIFTDEAWAAAGAAVTMALVAIGVTFGLIATGATIVIGAVVIAAAIGFGLALIDAKVGITPAIASAARSAAAYLDTKLPRDYVDYETAVSNMMLGGAP